MSPEMKLPEAPEQSEDTPDPVVEEFHVEKNNPTGFSPRPWKEKKKPPKLRR